MSGGEITLVPGLLLSVPSKTEDGKLHEVRLSKHGNIYCDCEGYAFRGHCSHIDALVQRNPMAKIIIKSSLRERIEHLKSVISSLDE